MPDFSCARTDSVARTSRCARRLALIGVAGVAAASPVSALSAEFTRADRGFVVPAALGDLNGDGFADLVGTFIVADADGGWIEVRLGLGGGRLDRPVRYSVANDVRSPQSLVIADVNGDGKQDVAWIARANPLLGASQLRWRLGDGAGALGLQKTKSLATTTVWNGGLAALDKNGDGASDLVVGADNGVWTATWLPATSTFGPMTRLLTNSGTLSVNAVELNQDNRTDLVVSGHPTGAGSSGESGFWTYLGASATTTGFGTPVYRKVVDTGGSWVIVAGDATGDGRSDVVTSFYEATQGRPEGTRVFAGDGAGGFTMSSLSSSELQEGVIGDFNRDGVVDIVAANAGVPTLYPGAGDGSFDLPEPLSIGYLSNILTADMNKDGKPDLVGRSPWSGQGTFIGHDVLLNTTQLIQIQDEETIGLNPDDPDAQAEVPPLVEQKSDGVDADGGGTGAFSHARTDVTLPGAGITFAMTRSYSSNNTALGPLGPGWTIGYGGSLTENPDLSVTVRTETGQTLVFERQPDGSYKPPAGIRATLTKNAGSWSMTNPSHNRFTFNAAGELTQLLDQIGVGLSLGYASGKLSQVTDDAGRSVAFTYNGDGLLDRVTLPDNRYVGYTYTAGRLTGVRDLRGGSTAYVYDGDGRMASMTDQNSHQVFSNTYNQTRTRLSSQTNAKNETTSFSWDSATKTLTTSTPGGGQWKQVYAGNVLIRETDPLGNETRYGYDKDLNRFVTADARGNATTSVYDARGNVTKTISPSPFAYVTTSTYDANDNLLTQTNGRGKTTTNVYNAQDQLVTSTDAIGGVTSYTYTAKGQIQTATNPRGKITTYAYNAAGDRTSTTTPAGNVTTMTYDGSGRMLTRVEPRGNAAGGTPADFRSTYTYNDADQTLTMTDPLGHATSYAYDPVGNRTTVTDARLKVTTTVYDELDRVTSVTDPRGGVATIAYNGVGNVTSRTNQVGDQTTYVFDLARRMIATTTPRGNAPPANPSDFQWIYFYDEVGNRTKSVDPLGKITNTTYDEMNRVTVVQDPLGHRTATGYDEESNVVSSTDALGNSTRSTFDGLDRVLTLTSPRGKVTTTAYDLNGNRTSVTASLGGKTTWTYDEDDRVQTMVEPRGNAAGATPATYTTSYAYNPDGDQVSVTDPLANQTVRSFDRDGNLSQTTDPLGRTTTLGYDELDRLVSVTGPDAPTCSTGPNCVSGKRATVYGLDDTGNMTSRTDPNGHTTTYTYDLAARPSRMTSAIGQRWDYAYDPDGNRNRVVTARGNAGNQAAGTITTDHDPLGRVTQTGYGDGTPTVTYGYDSAGRRVEMTDQDGTQTYSYDDSDRVTTIDRPSVGAFSYSYDQDGNITRRNYPDNTQIDATYDNNGRLATILADGSTTKFGYDVADRLRTVTLPTGNGHVETRTYDAAGRLTTVRNAKGSAVLSQFTRTLDKVGNPTKIVTGRLGVNTTEIFQYDIADRLAKWCQATTCTGATKTVTWAYDPIGNRTQQTRAGVANPGTTTYTYNDADQLTQTQSGAVVTPYTYDADGNQTGEGTVTSIYDLAGRLTTVTSGATTTSYAYDGDGRRLTRATNATVDTRYAWDTQNPLPELALERTDTNTPVRRYTHGLGGDPLALTTPAGTFYYHRDPIGSVTDVTDNAGTAQWRYAYEPYGEPLATTQIVSSAPDNQTRFTGEYLDPESGNYHLRARQYDPDTGRFSSLDPVDGSRTAPYTGEYVYVEANPLTGIDPSGLAKCGWNPKKWVGCGKNAAGKANDTYVKTSYALAPYNPMNRSLEAGDKSVQAFRKGKIKEGLKQMGLSVGWAATVAAPAAGVARTATVAGGKAALKRAVGESLDEAIGLPRSNRPAKVAGLRTRDGKIFTGRSGARNEPHPQMKRALDDVDTPSPVHGKCAEIECMNQALTQGENLKGARIRTVEVAPRSNPRSGAVASPCTTCAAVMRALGIKTP